MERNDTIDFIKFFAIFFVVCIHTSPFYDYQFGGIDGEKISFIINVFARFGVPYFFVISGYFLGQKLILTGKKSAYLKRYLLKITKQLVVWSVFFFFYDLITIALKSLVQGLNLDVEMSNYLASVFRIRNLYYGINAGTSYHLWYLAALIWSIIILAIFIKMGKVKLLLGIGFILNIAGVLGQSYSTLLITPLDTRDALFFGLFYVTLGYVLSNNFKYIKLKLKPYIWSILFLLFSFLQILEGELSVSRLNGIWQNYYFFTLLTIIALVLFVLTNPKINHALVNKVGANSVGIYVIHPLFISLSYSVVNILHLKGITHTLIWNLLFTPFIFIISYYSYHFLQEIKSGFRKSLRF
ncbi:acyltransferase [Neobacillus soli]|uniref:acyltransferase n=1 Tax=Neobacillus soli TaxID=220688 RepID=UPI00082455B1|nr:acyltransferase [Neobacillus soli]